MSAGGFFGFDWFLLRSFWWKSNKSNESEWEANDMQTQIQYSYISTKQFYCCLLQHCTVDTTLIPLSPHWPINSNYHAQSYNPIHSCSSGQPSFGRSIDAPFPGYLFGLGQTFHFHLVIFDFWRWCGVLCWCWKQSNVCDFVWNSSHAREDCGGETIILMANWSPFFAFSCKTTVAFHLTKIFPFSLS